MLKTCAIQCLLEPDGHWTLLHSVWMSKFHVMLTRRRTELFPKILIAIEIPETETAIAADILPVSEGICFTAYKKPSLQASIDEGFGNPSSTVQAGKWTVESWQINPPAVVEYLHKAGYVRQSSCIPLSIYINSCVEDAMVSSKGAVLRSVHS